jgi:hypothetical protein
MEVGLMLADFFHANEQHLFPPHNGYSGGNAYLAACAKAARDGWRVPAGELREAQNRKQARGALSPLARPGPVSAGGR